MDDIFRPRKAWQPDQESFDKLLACLHPDRDRAGEEYELLRQKLTEFFQNRGCLTADELADEVLNRLMRRIATGEQIKSLPRYSFGIARLVWQEELKKPGRQRVPLEELALFVLPVEDDTDEDARRACLKKSLQRLPADERRMFVEYWCSEDQANRDVRRALAERLGITLTALRIRVHRTKIKLEEAILRCLQRSLLNILEMIFLS